MFTKTFRLPLEGLECLNEKEKDKYKSVIAM